MIWIGTSGFQYPEWKGTFYPKDLAVKKMLLYYSARLPTTEINYSFYRIPSVSTIEGWAAETPARFRFTLKASRKITHDQRLKDCGDLVSVFWDAASHLNEKLAMVLFQLPPFFKKDVAVLNDFLALLPHHMKAAFEFRHASWFDDEVFAALRAHKVTLCIADSEKLSTPVVTTSEVGYFRLRDEGYTKKDIARWGKEIAGQGSKEKDIYVYFKHEESGVGPEFAAQLRDILKAEGAEVAEP